MTVFMNIPTWIELHLVFINVPLVGYDACGCVEGLGSDIANSSHMLCVNGWAVIINSDYKHIYGYITCMYIFYEILIH